MKNIEVTLDYGGWRSINYLLEKQYLSEFKVVDGLNQHPDGVNFVKWLDQIKEGNR